MKATVLTVLTFCYWVTGYAQGIIVNEISQGPSGQQEFIELLVVGSAAQPSGTVDLSDWIIDDNNGSFQLTAGGAAGLATGHFRFTANDTLNNVPIGSLIVLYNVGDKNPSWTFDSVDVLGNDIAYIDSANMVYYIPGNSTLLRACSLLPSATSTSYVYTVSSVPPTAANWTGQIGLANGGDAIQARMPDGTFYHGFGFSTPTATDTFLTVPAFSTGALPSFNAYKGSATGLVTYLDCGNWYFPGNYLTGGAAIAETPGTANTADNLELIESVKDGTFDYSALATDLPCPLILPVNLVAFNAKDAGAYIAVSWQVAKERTADYFDLEKSHDGRTWKSIRTIYAKGNGATLYEENDEHPLPGLNFYRLKLAAMDGSETYGPIASVHYTGQEDLLLSIYPNPVKDQVMIEGKNIENSEVAIVDVMGKTVYNGTIHKGKNTVDLSSLCPGIYSIRFGTSSGATIIRKLIKE